MEAVQVKVKSVDLKKFDLFTGLSDAEFAEIAGLSSRNIFIRNTTIFTNDDLATDVYLLEGRSDSVQIELPLSDSCQNIIIHTLKKGETFGWSALVPPLLRTAIARSLEDTEVIIVDGPGLLRICENNNHVGFMIMKNLSRVISSRLTCATVALRHRINKLADPKKIVPII